MTDSLDRPFGRRTLLAGGAVLAGAAVSSCSGQVSSENLSTSDPNIGSDKPAKMLTPGPTEPPTEGVPSGGWPKKMLVREIDITLDNGIYEVKFVRGNRMLTTSTTIKPTEVDDLIKKYLKSNPSPSNPTPVDPPPSPILTEYEVYPTETAPWADDVSSPISLKMAENAWIVYILRDETTGKLEKQFQFNHNGYPFTIERGKEGFYYHARRYNRRGGTLPVGQTGEMADNCRVAYMAAIAEDRAKSSPYIDSINIHLDFKVKNKTKDPGTLPPSGKTRKKWLYIPIVIDPDIRYPGGSADP